MYLLYMHITTCRFSILHLGVQYRRYSLLAQYREWTVEPLSATQWQTAPSLAINGVLVRQVAHTKSLGTHIDEILSWNVHV